MTVTAIALTDVTVRFPLYGVPAIPHARGRGAVGGMISRARSGTAFVEALRDVTLRFERGDRVGLVGHNGSGKSTLLRVVAGVYAPCRGSVRVGGRLLSLFDPMLGMSLDCNGRDNVVLRGIYMGLTPRQALAYVDEIADFCELGSYMDLPLKTWSLGMQLRLAFAVVTALDPDILLLDEQFMMGDVSFRLKAEARLRGFVARAGIVLQASHSEAVIRETCTRAVLLDHGRVTLAGTPDEVFACYGGAAEAAAAQHVA